MTQLALNYLFMSSFHVRLVPPARPTQAVRQSGVRAARTARLAALALTLLLPCAGVACGGDTPSSTTAKETDAGQDAALKDSGATTKKMDAGHTTSANQDAGDKQNDSGVRHISDAGNDSAVMSPVDAGGDVHYDPGPAPDTWTCAAALWADGYCDCGCGTADADCVGQSCTEPGCIATSCDACYTPELAWKPCAPAPDPSDWTCSMASQTDMLCDCGCTVPDDACGGSGCVEPGCWRGACDLRHGTDGSVLALQRPPSTWTCPTAAWGGGNGCDCGCGAVDPDCYSAHNCTAPLCNDTECAICHDSTGRNVPCDDALTSWTCDPQRYGSGDGCDCGCGTADPDCAGQGCDQYGCRADACTRCTDSSYAQDELVGCASTKDWTCDLGHYGTGDGCDCGCGIADPDCGQGNGCAAAGCQDTQCDYCHKGDSTVPQADNDYQICNPGWTCGSESDPAWANAECDCGCGKPDPYCRLTDRLSCSDPGCSTATCDYCNTDTGTRALCDGPHWSAEGTCARRDYGLDGKCDCGCGAIDPDCAAGAGCADPFCAADGCEICHGSGTLLATCYTWHCPAADYGDGKCDCGCGAPDPDCSGLGCSEPGCRGDMDVCKPDGCHDPYGRTVPCP